MSSAATHGCARWAARDLFGGALRAELPSEMLDVSAVREVPDNQEVWAHQESDRSLIVEILELEPGLADAVAAARFFAQDLAAANDAVSAREEWVERLVLQDAVPALDGLAGAEAAVVVTLQEIAKFRER